MRGAWQGFWKSLNNWFQLRNKGLYAEAVVKLLWTGALLPVGPNQENIVLHYPEDFIVPHSDLEAPPRQSFMVSLALIFLLCICHEMSVWNLLGVQSTLQACDTGIDQRPGGHILCLLPVAWFWAWPLYSEGTQTPSPSCLTMLYC